MTDEINLTQQVVGGTTLLGIAVFALQKLMTSWKTENTNQSAASSQQELMKNLKEEAKKWQDLYDKEVADHSDARRQYEVTLILLGEVRNQNKMLRLLLIQRGMSPEELDVVLDITVEGHEHG
jgi:hypothetical protein